MNTSAVKQAIIKSVAIADLNPNTIQGNAARRMASKRITKLFKPEGGFKHVKNS